MSSNADDQEALTLSRQHVDEVEARCCTVTGDILKKLGQNDSSTFTTSEPVTVASTKNDAA